MRQNRFPLHKRRNLSFILQYLCAMLLSYPTIRGWTNYHKSVCAKRIFLSAEHEIFYAIWTWARRRHSRKGGKWIRNKYFRSIGNQNWVFFARIYKPNASPSAIMLMEAGKVKIIRHVKVKADATPYDPAYTEYFASRKARNQRLGKVKRSIG